MDESRHQTQPHGDINRALCVCNLFRVPEIALPVTPSDFDRVWENTDDNGIALNPIGRGGTFTIPFFLTQTRLARVSLSLSQGQP